MLFFQIPLRSSCAVCFSPSSFTQHGSTGAAQFGLLGRVRVTASLTCSSPPREWEGAAVLVHGRALRISGSKASFGGLQLILAAAQWLLRAPWLLLHLACPHLVLAWLCSPALLWTYLLSPPHFNLHSPFYSGTALPLVPGISQCSPGPSSW